MEKNRTIYDLQYLDAACYDAIETDFILLENPVSDQKFYDPLKTEYNTAIIFVAGFMKIKVNVREYEIKGPCLFNILTKQIVQYQQVSPDLKAYFVVMSDRYADKLFLDLTERYPLKHSVLANPLTPLNELALKSLVDNFHSMRDTVRMRDNPFRTEILKHQILAFFYSTTYQYRKSEKDISKSKFDILFDNFLNLMQHHFKQNRDVEFYAAKLFITRKYLSKILKEKTGKTASEWISDHVILEAQALLKSTSLTIQQISEELNFPSQSFFGKYFKQHVGVSPKEYRLNSLDKKLY